MGFLDQLSGKLSEAGKSLKQAGTSAAQQTKDFTDRTKLNAQIHQYEKDIEAQYTALGRALYKQKPEEAKTFAPEIVAKIEEASASIKKAQDEILAKYDFEVTRVEQGSDFYNALLEKATGLWEGYKTEYPAEIMDRIFQDFAI